jgi:hypothetical protein
MHYAFTSTTPSENFLSRMAWRARPESLPHPLGLANAAVTGADPRTSGEGGGDGRGLLPAHRPLLCEARAQGFLDGNRLRGGGTAALRRRPWRTRRRRNSQFPRPCISRRKRLRRVTAASTGPWPYGSVPSAWTAAQSWRRLRVNRFNAGIPLVSAARTQASTARPHRWRTSVRPRRKGAPVASP